ncbi:nucleoside triphosphate pyrophosphohydrolase [Methylocaldum sp.]|uniref:nucleoside triphosphate pyrophosphohydrolase n=1 Tax=Methylocaldum sp. TaxID=1969727 RepID=UPI002D2D006E|nr:nucleoside triphosphate pyrophosphohydrolase [Methylocaldum sp.]HYE37687.1 nucleoside triphosphate pyrophosphohydrolase [Methylocaldum sp.]
MKNTRRLLDIMARLRHPETGCPWDLQQDFASLIPHTLEEAYEVADAAERGDAEDLREELGDLLLQVVFHSRIAEERGLFTFEDVADAISEKLIRRHPHVFGETVFETDIERHEYWESSKVAERREKGKTANDDSALSGIAVNLPALMAAQKLQKRAARHGFDWTEIEPVFDKVREELDELQAAYAASDQGHIHEEIGDLLFVVVNLARHLKVDAETALRDGNRKFIRRFRHIETQLAARGKTLAESTLAELDALWDEAKRSL